MSECQQDQGGGPAGISSADLDSLRPTLERTTRVARALFACRAADVVVLMAGRTWRVTGATSAADPCSASVVRTRRARWAPDLTLEKDCADHPAVVATPNLRFYAGAPIILEDGRCLGALCVVDVLRRPYDPERAALLEDMAAGVASECDRLLALRERDAALERMARTEQRLNQACQLADVHVYEIDYVNGVLLQEGSLDSSFYGDLSYEDLKANVWAGVHPDDLPIAKAAWKRHLAEQIPYRAEYRTIGGAGAVHWVSATAQLESDEQGRPLRLVGAIQHISQRKAVEAAMARAVEAADAASQAKSAFLATMSHEIRTPLNGVLGMAQVMARDALPDFQRERLGMIQEQGESLLSLLNDLLDLSKVEAGRLELEDGVVEVAKIAHAAQATFTALASDKDIYLALSVAPGAQGAWRGDPARVGQIINNLMANAVKFTERGSIQFDVLNENGVLVFRVTDTGQGVAPERLDSLFDKFVQADASTTRRFGGSGLGLAICRELATAMGGEIDARSTVGQGSVFTVRLPLARLTKAVAAAPAAEEAAEAPATPPVGALKVLAAEDNLVNQRVLKALLAAAEVDTHIVGDGEEAVAAWAAGDWDIVLMDVQMPVMDGVAATREIRRREKSEGRRRTPIIALTANAMSHHHAEYLAAGMDLMVAKPIRLEQLFAAITRLCAAPEAQDVPAVA